MSIGLRVQVNPGSIEQLKSGRIVGEIVLVGSGWVYPMKGWSDFPVVVLGWWFTALQRVGSRIGASALCRFMDGPYAFRVTSVSQERWIVECLNENGVGILHSEEANAEAFKRNIEGAATEVVQNCLRMGLNSPDVEHLRTFIRLLPEWKKT